MENNSIMKEDRLACLLETKAKLKQNISNLNGEIANIKRNISRVKNEKTQVQNSQLDLVLKENKLTMSIYELNLEINSLLKRNQWLNDFNKRYQVSIEENTSLLAFEKEMMLIKERIESAMAFYTDESLQMELMKRSSAIREKRVELTSVESEYKELERKIQERQREKERQKQLELERLRQEEEKLKKLEEEKALAEKIKRNEAFKQQKLEPLGEHAQPFLEKFPSFISKSFNDLPNNTTGQFIRDQSTGDESLQQGSDKKNKFSRDAIFSSSPIKSSNPFSQLLHW